MKTLFLTTRTNEVAKYGESLAALGWGPVDTVVYDIPGTSDQLLYSQVKTRAPDFIVYIGSRWGQQPSYALLAKINYSVAPMIHLCSDAADPPWHDVLREYHMRGAFTLQVAIDGNKEWPTAPANLTLLTPVDPVNFPTDRAEHQFRTVACGWGGNAGGGGTSLRSETLAYLLERRLLSLRIRSNLPFTYESYCEFLTTCRLSLNIAHSGSESVMQVKGRVLETALAGACLMENKGAPTSHWFDPEVDYLEYTDNADAERIIKLMRDKPDITGPMGANLRKKVMERHSPMRFWSQILERIGMKLPEAA